MSSFLARLLGQSKSARSRELAELQLCLIVAIAAADGRIHELELEQVDHFVDRAGTTSAEHARLSRLAQELLEDPPEFEHILHELERFADRTALGGRIVAELDHVAHADDELDYREEFYIDLVRNVFGLPHVEDEHDLSALAGQLAQVHRRAA